MRSSIRVAPCAQFLDPRLLFTADDIKPLTYVTCFPTYKGRLWEPNWLFLNAVEVHGPVRETLLLRPKGKMELSGYFTVKFFSPFDLAKFPFDNQAYTIQVQMWDQPDEEVHLHFPKSGNAINIVSADTSLWYVSTSNRTSTSLSVNKMSSGSFTTLTGKVYVQRGTASYIISYILPVNLIALISYFGYFMDPR